MITGFEVYGAIGTSVALLNLARQCFKALLDTYRDYEKVGRKIVRLEGDCNAVYFTIGEWRKSWGLHEKTSDDLYRAFWSERGWDLIQTQVAAIESDCADLAVLAHRSLRMTPNYNDTPKEFEERIKKELKTRAPGTRRSNPTNSNKLEKASLSTNGDDHHDIEMRRINKLHAIEKIVTKCTTPWKKARFTLSQGEEIQTCLEALEKGFTKLRCLVNDAWSSQHKGVDPNTSTFERKRILGISRVYKSILEEAEDKKSRPGISLLYDCCTASRKPVMLDMNLVKNITEDPQGKLFRILIPWSPGNGHLDISADILHENPLPLRVGYQQQQHQEGPSDYDLECCDEFDDAIGKIQKDGQGLLRIKETRTHGHRQRNVSTTWFKLCRTSPSSQRRESEMFNLAVKLKDLFKAERMNIAYSIAESGLLLLGTSWLSVLSSTTLKRLKPYQRAPRYILDVKDDRNSLLTRLQHENTNIHLYIFTIGTALVEVALRNAIKDVTRSSSGLRLRDYRSGTPCDHSLRSIVSEVEQEMGEEYSSAVKFCLQDPVLAPNRSWKDGVLYDTTVSEEEMSMELLGLFYEKVFIP